MTPAFIAYGAYPPEHDWGILIICLGLACLAILTALIMEIFK